MTDPDNTEIWREVPDWPNYRVSSHGRVWSSHKRGHIVNGTSLEGGRLMKGVLVGRLKYPMVTLCPGNHKIFIHVLVMQVFVGPRPPGMQVRHVHDPNPMNARLSNLEYGTDSQNKFDSVRHGTHTNASKTHCKRGHAFTPENTESNPGKSGDRANGWRLCRACHIINAKASNQRRRAARLLAGDGR